MIRGELVRSEVARLVWRSNPHSVRLAAVAVQLAAMEDCRQVRDALRLTLSHLRGCGREPSALDGIRADYCDKRADVLAEWLTGSG